MYKLLIFSVLSFQIFLRYCNGDCNHTSYNDFLDYDETNDNFTGRISGGNIIHPPHKYPFVVTVEGMGEICAGVLIGNQFVLSAAQCVPDNAKIDAQGRVDDSTAKSFTVYAGVHKKDDKCIALPVEAMIIPQNYKVDSKMDILFIKLQIPIEDSFKNFARPISFQCDANIGKPYTSATAVGWSFSTSGNETTDEFLKEVSVKILSDQECYHYFPYSKYIICAYAKGTGPCLRDVGAPLFVKQDDNYCLVGIMSASLICGSDPVRYTKVSEFQKWILDNINTIDII